MKEYKLPQMIDLWRSAVIFTITAVIIIMVCTFHFGYIGRIKGKSMPVKTEPEIATATVADRNISVLTDWVYSRSSKITRMDCKKIVDASVDTGKPLLMIALVDVESNFTPTAVSAKGAIGLTQVMFDVHKRELISTNLISEKRDLFDIEKSIYAGDFILSGYIIQSKGDVSAALEKYLGGRDGVYVKKILINLANLYLITRE